MPSDEDDRPILLCNQCQKPVYHDPDSETKPQRCACGDDADAWRIADKEEVLRRAGEWD